MSGPGFEVRLPPIDDQTSVEMQVAVLALRDALRGEEVSWPSGASEGWAKLREWAELIPGTWAAYVPGATALMFATGGRIIRRNERRTP